MTDRQFLGQGGFLGEAMAGLGRRLRRRATVDVILLSLCVVACSSDDKKKVLADGCALNSDCSSGLVCSFGRCHTPCVTSKDCPTGAGCVKTSGGGAVCQLPAEASCDNDSGCPEPLVCGVDQNCRGTCKSLADCPSGQKCSNQKLCAEPSQVDANNDIIVKGGGGASGVGGAGGGNTSAAGATTPGGSASVGGNSAAGAPNAGGTTPTMVGGSSNAGTTSAGGTAAGGSVGAGGNANGGTTLGGSTNGGNVGTAGAGVVDCTGRGPTYFGHVATSDSNANYTSGVGVRTATEFVIFNGFVGDSTGGAAGAAGTAGVATKVNRIDVQHFDPSTGASNGDAAPLFVAAGDGAGLYINGAAVAPTGEVAIVYSAATYNVWGTYLAFLDKDLVFKQTTQIVALGLDQDHDQSYVEWLNGKFVASAVVGDGSSIKLVKFGADGANAGSTSAIPTDNPSGLVAIYNPGEGEVAFSGGQSAVAYLNWAAYLPYLTILDAGGVQIGSPIELPASLAASDAFASVAGTSQGFMAVYNGTSATSAASLLATFVSNSLAAGGAGSGGAGAGGGANDTRVGSTYSFPGGYALRSARAVRGSSDGIGAGFAALYPDGSVSFLYFSGDGSTRTSPQNVLQQSNQASVGDLVCNTTYAGSFVLSLYSSAEHLTRIVASSCQ